MTTKKAAEHRGRAGKPPRLVSLVSLGCAKNLVDSERVLGMLAEKGFIFCTGVEDSDVALVNTCCFIDEAKEESLEELLKLAEIKKERKNFRIVAMGCLAQRHAAELMESVPEVDAVVGFRAYSRLPAVLNKVLAGEKVCDADRACFLDMQDGARLVTGGGVSSWLKISEGCDNRCSYCAIPGIRGPLRSRPVEKVVAEARELIDFGVREINIIAQDTAAYGLDLGRPMLPELIGRLAAFDKGVWFRLLYAHPAHLTGEIIDAVARFDNFVKYIDMPVQHANDRILASMGRNITRKGLEALVAKIRGAIDGCALRTTVMVGYPGETDAEFSELLDFIRGAGFERLGAFAYSAQEGPASAKLADDVFPAAKEERLSAVLTLQRRVMSERNAGLIGARMKVLLTGRSPRKSFPLVGRTFADAPDVDCEVFIGGGGAKDAKPGRFAEVEITGADGCDLEAKLIRRN